MFLFTMAVLMAVGCAIAKELPPYIVPCRLADRNFEECAIKSGNDALPTIVKGDKNFKVLNHAPLVIPEVVLQATAGLVMKLNDVRINFEKAKLTSFKLDPVKKTMKLHLLSDFHFDGNYDMKGRILLIPLEGNGPFNASLDNEDIGFSATYDLVEKNGKDYMKLLTGDVYAFSKHAGFYFDNLFGGNSQLSEEINKALNDNWREFTEEFRPAVKTIWTSIFRNVIAAYLQKIPFSDLFP